jgi:hypothetical protein
VAAIFKAGDRVWVNLFGPIIIDGFKGSPVKGTVVELVGEVTERIGGSYVTEPRYRVKLDIQYQSITTRRSNLEPINPLDLMAEALNAAL